jgi:hypothetical protein
MFRRPKAKSNRLWRRAPDQLSEPRARVIADDDAIAAVSCHPAIARPIVENLDDLAPPWIDNGNAVVDHRGIAA